MTENETTDFEDDLVLYFDKIDILDDQFYDFPTITRVIVAIVVIDSRCYCPL